MAFVRAQGASSSQIQYEVFLSFRGPDTRLNFTSHLHEALKFAGFRTFRDDLNLPKGEIIRQELNKAIQQSRCSIVVLSKEYASSEWCLDELLVILECKRNFNQFVLPLFYDVEVSHVRHQEETFAKAFTIHQVNQPSDVVNRWREALKDVAGLTGLELKDRYEAEFIQEVVKFISTKMPNPAYQKKIPDLEMKLLSAKHVLDYAEGKLLSKPSMKELVDILKEAIYVAEDLLDETKTYSLMWELEDKFGNSITDEVQGLNCSTFPAFDSTSISSRIEDVKKSLDWITREITQGLNIAAENSLKYPTATSTSTSLVEDCVYGRDEEKEWVIELLLHDGEPSNELNVFPIVGMGGIGKTTFAHLIYNDGRVREHYDLFAWIYVSEKFDVFGITQNIDYKINGKTYEASDLDTHQQNVKMTMIGKKFFIVLDDVWNDNSLDWDLLRRPLQSGAHGSTIFVTTRRKDVADRMGTFQAFHLKEITDEDAWLLFKKHVIGPATPSNLENMRRKVVEKCKGLPLAIKALAGLFRPFTSEEQWESALNDDIWEVEEKVLPALLVSYHYLPANLRRCFAYCSIFPRGYGFERAEVISLWKAEDLIGPIKKKMVEEVGEEYFNILVSNSFFQPSLIQATENKVYHTMHDLINNLAKFVSGEFSIRWEDIDSSSDLTKTRHFSFIKRYVQKNEKFEALRGGTSLRTFLPLTEKMKIQTSKYQMRSEVINDLLPTLRCLRVLNLSDYDIAGLPDSINNLIHLRHLNLSSTSISKLPDSICTLCNLQELLLADCRLLTALPTNLGRLIELTHLDLKGCRLLTALPTNFEGLIKLTHLELKGTNLNWMPALMGNLEDLKLLDKYVLNIDTAYHDVLELKKLQKLRGALHISGIRNIILHDSVMKVNILKDQKFLREVVLDWINAYELEEHTRGFHVKLSSDWYRSLDDSDLVRESELLDKLQPHRDLENLTVKFYRGTAFPDWTNYYSSCALVCLRLIRCVKCITLPALGQLPFLKELHIDGLSRVKSIGPEFYGNSSVKPFRSLQVLVVDRMDKLEEWSTLGDAGHELKLFPNLVELRLKMLRSLTGKFAFDNFPMLEILEIFVTRLSLAVSQSPNEPLALTSLILSCCSEIVSFPDNRLCAPKLTYLRIGLCENLRSMPKQMNTLLPFLQKLEIHYCEKLESFQEGGLPSELQLLNISCQKFIPNHKEWGLNRLSSLRELFLECEEYEEVVESFPEEGIYLPSSLTSIRIENFLKLKTINPEGVRHLNSLRTLQITNCPALQCLPEGVRHLNSLCTLWITKCPALQCLPGEKLPTSLTELYIKSCPLLNERCERKRGQDWPKIAHIPIINIDGERI